MTIQNTTLRKAGPSQGNGVTTVFPFTFKVFTATDILVTYLNASSVESVLVLTTNYTVSLNADQNTSPGGSVTLLVAPATATYITLTSQVTNTQTLALTNSGGFYPESINNALDRTVIEIQQLAEQASRSITIPKSSTASPLLPSPAANNVLVWNNTATSLINLPATAGTSLVNLAASTGSTLVGTTKGGSGSVTRTVASKLNDTVSVLDFGADRTGVADSTTAFTNAQLAVGGVAGGTLLVPKGTYLVSSIARAVSGDFTWINKGWAAAINLASAVGTSAQLITIGTPNTTPLSVTDSRVGLSVTAAAYGAQHCSGVRSNIYNYSTNGNGNTGFYGAAVSASTALWTAALHGETQHGGGTSLGVNSESASFTTTGAFYGASIQNATTAYIGSTHPITAASPVAHPSATALQIVGANNVDPMGGWVTGLSVTAKAMRTGSIVINILSDALVRSHFETSTSSASSVADILLQGNSAYGILLNGTYTNAAIRLVSGQSIDWELTGAIKSYLGASNIWTLANAGERFGVIVGANPNIRLNETQVVGVRATGWTAMTGTTDKASAFATSTVTLVQLAGRVMALQAALTLHGLIGA